MAMNPGLELPPPAVRRLTRRCSEPAFIVGARVIGKQQAAALKAGLPCLAQGVILGAVCWGRGAAQLQGPSSLSFLWPQQLRNKDRGSV